MRKAFLYCFILLIAFSLPVYSSDDVWDDFIEIDRSSDGQKSITNKEFEEAINTLEKNKTKKEEKQRQKMIKKVSGGGTSLHPDLNPDNAGMNSQVPLSKNTEGETLNIPVDMVIGEDVLDKGFYKIIIEKNKDGEIYFKFYQSQFLKGEVKAQVTDEDYDEYNIDFVKWLPYNDNYIKIIFGSLDYNAYAYVQYKD